MTTLPHFADSGEGVVNYVNTTEADFREANAVDLTRLSRIVEQQCVKFYNSGRINAFRSAFQRQVHIYKEEDGRPVSKNSKSEETVTGVRYAVNYESTQSFFKHSLRGYFNVNPCCAICKSCTRYRLENETNFHHGITPKDPYCFGIISNANKTCLNDTTLLKDKWPVWHYASSDIVHRTNKWFHDDLCDINDPVFFTDNYNGSGIFGVACQQNHGIRHDMKDGFMITDVNCSESGVQYIEYFCRQYSELLQTYKMTAEIVHYKPVPDIYRTDLNKLNGYYTLHVVGDRRSRGEVGEPWSRYVDNSIRNSSDNSKSIRNSSDNSKSSFSALVIIGSQKGVMCFNLSYDDEIPKCIVETFFKNPRALAVGYDIDASIERLGSTIEPICVNRFCLKKAYRARSFHHAAVIGLSECVEPLAYMDALDDSRSGKTNAVFKDDDLVTKVAKYVAYPFSTSNLVAMRVDRTLSTNFVIPTETSLPHRLDEQAQEFLELCKRYCEKHICNYSFRDRRVKAYYVAQAVWGQRLGDNLIGKRTEQSDSSLEAEALACVRGAFRFNVQGSSGSYQGSATSSSTGMKLCLPSFEHHQ